MQKIQAESNGDCHKLSQNCHRKYLTNGGNEISPPLFILFNIFKLITISSAECERRFSQMNLICTTIRSSVSVVNLSRLMFVKLNGSDFIRFNSLEYVRSWLTSHQSAESERNTNHPDWWFPKKLWTVLNYFRKKNLGTPLSKPNQIKSNQI